MALWCFLMKTLTFHQWFSIHNFMLNTRWVKKEVLSKIISLSTWQTLHKCNERLSWEEKKLYKIINITNPKSTKNIYHNYKAKLTFCSCSQQWKQNLKLAAKKWTDNITFQFRNDLLWTGLQGNYLLATKIFLGKWIIVQSKHCISDA